MMTKERAVLEYENNLDSRINASVNMLRNLFLKYIVDEGYVCLVANNDLNYSRLHCINLTAVFKHDMTIAFYNNAVLLSGKDIIYRKKLDNFLTELYNAGYVVNRFDDNISIDLYSTPTWYNRGINNEH